MNRKTGQSKELLYQQEGWDVENNIVYAYGETFPLVHPLAIHLKTYRLNPSQENRYLAMVRAFEIFWPKQILTYNYWMERMFREHVNHDTEVFTLAGGAGLGKTQAMAYIGSIFFRSLPNKNTVIVASTELASLKSRIYGYMLRALQEATFQIPLHISNSPPPSIRNNPDDFVHGIYGIAAKRGDEDKTIQAIKGRHPLDSILLILDECTDMPVGIMSAFPNLKKGLKGRFQAVGIGNSKSWSDLHGALSMPKVGIENIDPYKTYRWQTTQAKGICLYFNPYDSPAISEIDPVKKEALSQFLVTKEKLIIAEKEEGVDSEAFWQFTMGFWRSRTLSNTIVSEAFLKNYDPTKQAEFSGKVPFIYVAGLDPAFVAGGDKCILRLAVLAEHRNGLTILDFRGEALKFEIILRTGTGKTAEIQIGEEVIRICKLYNIPLNTLCIDASGQGRGIADVIQLLSGGGLTPTKIYSTNVSNRLHAKSHDVVISSSHEMWFQGRDFISHNQIFGLDALAYAQLHHRLVVDKGGKKLLEDKPTYRKRMTAISSILGRSPDEADAAMLTLQSAILHHGFHTGQRRMIKVFDTTESKAIEDAARAYKETLKKSYTHKANYKGTIVSLLNRKLF